MRTKMKTLEENDRLRNENKNQPVIIKMLIKNSNKNQPVIIKMLIENSNKNTVTWESIEKKNRTLNSKMNSTNYDKL